MNILEFSWESFAFAVINFLILCALLYKFLHKPLVQMLDRRRERLESARENAEGEAARAREQRQQYEQRMAGIEEERDNLLSEARKHAEEQREKILEEARERARREVDNLRRGYERERADALRDLQGDIAEIALRTAREILDIRERLNGLLARHTGQTVERIAQDVDRDRFLSPQEAADYGLIDRVLTGPMGSGEKPVDSATIVEGGPAAE